MSHNTWIHRVARVTIVQPLRPLGVKPNQITTVRLTTGVMAAVVLGGGGIAVAGWAATLFALAMLLDRADGDLARTTGQTSAAGHRYDLASDAICNALIFVGLGVGLRDGQYGLMAIIMGIAAGLAVVAILAMVVRIEASIGERAAELGSSAGFDADDAIIAVPIALWLGYADGLLLAAAIGAPVFAIGFFAFFRKKLLSPKTST